jgi:hypothetical protein
MKKPKPLHYDALFGALCEATGNVDTTREADKVTCEDCRLQMKNMPPPKRKAWADDGLAGYKGTGRKSSFWDTDLNTR